jgi:hypothetical protein
MKKELRPALRTKSASTLFRNFFSGLKLEKFRTRSGRTKPAAEDRLGPQPGDCDRGAATLNYVTQ